jgi:predicted nucleic acid-binding protein
VNGVLVDANVLLRQFEPGHPGYRAALDTTTRLIASGEALYLVPQTLTEFWAAATRPRGRQTNGLLSLAMARAALDRFELTFTLLPDHPAIYGEWKRLVWIHRVGGNGIYDTRLVAAMLVHGVRSILTFDAGFARYEVQVSEPMAGP